MKKHKKTKHWYMHTLAGRPAHFDMNTGKGTRQIVYRHGIGDIVVPVETLKQIQREQRQSIAFRTKQEWNIPEYGYVRVAVPEQDV